MKAIVSTTYGPIDRLVARDIAMPKIGDTEVLVRVRTAGLHIGDVFGVKGSPFAMRLASGLTRPKYGVPGFDLAGEVQQVGSSVARFKPGDAVFGAGTGTVAEYARAAEDTLAPKPATMSFEEAAAIPTSGLAALHGLRDAGRVEAGEKVLINGASGGVGSFAVQIAKAVGAEVTGVCSTRNVELVRSLGADHVIDYTREDFTAAEGVYDLIFDNIENRTMPEVRRALKPHGTLVFNSGTGTEGFATIVRLLRPMVTAPFVGHNLRRFLSKPNAADLLELKRLAEAGQLRPAIDRTYPLAETAAALHHIESGHARGKVVIVI